jgi:hypothetical protein
MRGSFSDTGSATTSQSVRTVAAAAASSAFFFIVTTATTTITKATTPTPARAKTREFSSAGTLATLGDRVVGAADSDTDGGCADGAAELGCEVGAVGAIVNGLFDGADVG